MSLKIKLYLRAKMNKSRNNLKGVKQLQFFWNSQKIQQYSFFIFFIFPFLIFTFNGLRLKFHFLSIFNVFSVTVPYLQTLLLWLIDNSIVLLIFFKVEKYVTKYNKMMQKTFNFKNWFIAWVVAITTWPPTYPPLTPTQP